MAQTQNITDRKEDPAAPQLKVVDTPVNPARAPSFEIQSNVNAVRYLKALVYGEYGSGKTYLMGSSVQVPQMRDVLLISIEAGELTLYDPDNPMPFHLIDIVNVHDYKTTGRVYDFLKLHCSVRDEASQGDEEAKINLLKLQNRLMPNVPDPDRLRLYRTVIIDSLAEVEANCMMQLLGVGSESMIDEEVAAEGWDEYRRQRSMIHRLIRGFRNLPMNILFTCPRHFRENEQKRRIYGPMMTGKLSNEVQGFMDLVGHLVVGSIAETAVAEGEEIPDAVAARRMYIQPGPRHAAKSRFTRYKKPYMDNPTMLTIMKDVGLLDQSEKKS